MRYECQKFDPQALPLGEVLKSICPLPKVDPKIWPKSLHKLHTHTNAHTVTKT